MPQPSPCLRHKGRSPAQHPTPKGGTALAGIGVYETEAAALNLLQPSLKFLPRILTKIGEIVRYMVEPGIILLFPVYLYSVPVVFLEQQDALVHDRDC